MASKVTPFLMFQGGVAETALSFYRGLFPGSEVSGEVRAEGAFQRATLTIAGQEVILFESPVKHAFTFTPASSLFVECESEAEIRRLGDALQEGGEALMPLDNYGFSRLFVWVNDRFGVSWQINLV